MNVSASNHLASFAQLVKNSTQRFAALPAHVQWDIYGTLKPNHYICKNESQLMAYNALFAYQHFAKLIDLFDFVFDRFIKLEQITALQNTTKPNCIKQSLSGVNIFVCCSPNYSQAINGINQFCDAFDVADESMYYCKDYCDVETFEMRSQRICKYRVPRYAKIFVIQ